MNDRSKSNHQVGVVESGSAHNKTLSDFQGEVMRSPNFHQVEIVLFERIDGRIPWEARCWISI